MMFMWIVPILLLTLLWDTPSRRGRSISCTLLAAVLLALPGLGLLWMGGGMHRYGYGFAFPRWSWVVAGTPLLIIIGVVGYLALRADRRDTQGLEILRLRLARGEISVEDYEVLRQKLSS